VPARTATTEDVRRLLEQGATAIEVLPRSEYEAEHLPGAISIPLPELVPEAVADVDREGTVIVYCYDTQCDLSSRGAALLAALGFSDVRDYVGSKAAWLAEGLPCEGTVPASSRAGAIADPKVPTCRLDETLEELAGRLGAAALAVVVDGDGTVLGVVRREVLGLPGPTRVRDALRPAPPSVRPSITARELARSMDRDRRDYVLVTTQRGLLLGLVRREDLVGQH
jgi:rhodanese-related sulfurtransferase